jgi:hypothetical protein
MKKLILILLLALAALAVILFILLGRYTDRVIDPYVRSLLEQTKPMNHRIDYKRIRVNLFERNIILKEVRLFPDSSLTDQDLRLEIRVQKIQLTGFGLKSMLFGKRLNIHELVIQGPEVVLYLPPVHEEVMEDLAEKDTANLKKDPLLTHITLDKIILSGGSFQMIRNQVILASSPDISFLAEGIELEKNSHNEPIGFKYNDYTITLSDIDLHSESSLYDFSLERFEASRKNLSITLEGLRFRPLFDKKEFSAKLDYQNDRLDVSLGRMKLIHTGLARLLEGKPLHIVTLQIDSLKADIYRDKNVPFNYQKFPKFYNESFLKIDIPLTIDTLDIVNSQIHYQELAEGRQAAGSIQLEEFTARAYNLTNQVEADTAENNMHFYIEAKVMGEGKLRAELILPLEGNLRDFRCHGSVGAMQLKPLNDMLEPAINIRIEGGLLDRMTFDFSATDNQSSGWMEFLYHDLDVVLLKKEGDEKKSKDKKGKEEKERGFISFVANQVAHSNNPPPGKPARIVEIGYERDKNKGIINYIWKTIQSGLVRTIVPSGKYLIKSKKANTEKADTGKGKSGKEKKDRKKSKK